MPDTVKTKKLDYPFDVIEYNGKSSILNVLKDYTNGLIDDKQSESNKRFDYLDDYLGQNGIGVQTVVFEFDYIDKDYTEDYARFYSRCFRHYPSKCIRLHFFTDLFDKAEFKRYLLNQENKNIQDSYAGFVVFKDEIGENYRLSTSWGRFDDKKVLDEQKGIPRDKQIEAAPTLLMIPLYHKIRIPFELILRIVNEFSSFTKLASFVVWDIYLTTACKLKQMFREYSGKINDEERLKLLTYNYPRYIWVVDARLMGMEHPEDFPPDFSYYFDATDIPHSDFFLFALHWEPDSRKLIKDMIQKVVVNKYESHQVNQIIDYYKDPNKLNPNQTSSLLKIDPLPKILPTSAIQ
ncbi:MAG: hypothetical protein LBQ39_03450 [Tannerellaceae bacterium]|jgi:hypothetical protein|nr:hypothetical protein [Tannerellaceae bacterium]